METNILDSKKRKRPARKQASEADVFEDPPHTGFYNIWYDRVQDYSTWRDRRDAKLAGKRFKLDLEKDVGETMAKSTAYICLFFARGKCIHGPECKYKHAIPTYEDEAKLDTFHDVFGRERHRTDRDDMGGVGSFNRENHTLYIGGVRMVPNVEEMVRKYFAKFGEITDMKILPGRSIAFITYRYRVCAEFAKEAMSDQSLIGNEVLNVRWANEDPNPQVQHQKQDKQRAEAWEQMQHTHPDFFKQYELLEQQKYPDTDAQYQGNGAGRKAKSTNEDEDKDQDEEEDKAPEDVNWAPKKQESGSPSPSASPNHPPSSPKQTTEGQAQETTPVEQPTDEPVKDPQHAEYEAWQTWYRQQGYPGYYDHEGNYHYYDPKVFDPYASGYARSSKKARARQRRQQRQQQQEQEQQEGQEQEEYPDNVDYYPDGDPYAQYAGMEDPNAQYAAMEDPNAPYDYYNYYAGMGVAPEQTQNSWNYFDGYGGEEAELPGQSNAPLYQ